MTSFTHFELLFSGHTTPTEMWRGLSACLFESTPLSCHQDDKSSDQCIGCLKLFHAVTRHDVLTHIDTWNTAQASTHTIVNVHRIAGVTPPGPHTERTWFRHVVETARTQGGTAYHKWTHKRLTNQLQIDMVPQPILGDPQRRATKRPEQPPTAPPPKRRHLSPRVPTPKKPNLEQVARILVELKHRKGKEDSEVATMRAEIQRMGRIIELQSELLRLRSP